LGDKIVKLMAVATPQRNLQWLKDSLQAAIELELSTLPPYLCGMWSISDPVNPPGFVAHQLIDSVVKEEMTHLGLVCNLLTAIGGKPQIAKGYATCISYPGPLPGGVRPQLNVFLGGLTKPYVHDVYMQIEYPEGGPIHFAELAEIQSFPTIGAFYDAVQEAFEHLSPVPNIANQLTFDSLGFRVTVIQTLAQVADAIALIKVQGEGTSSSPEAGSELAHFYRFAEMYVGKGLVMESGGGFGFTGTAIPFPDTHTMAPIPKSGYQDPSPEVRKALITFDTLFSTMLDTLDNAWSTGSQTMLNAAISIMRKLKAAAAPLWTMPLPIQVDGFYGPDFKYIPTNERTFPMSATTTQTPIFSDIVALLQTLAGNDPNLGTGSPHGAFWNQSYEAFIAQKTDAWGVPGSLVVKGDPSSSNLYLALAGKGPFGGFPPQMPDISSDPNGRLATGAELEMVSSWITSGCPK
jgi:Ferritin-like